jgi:hypothetical protein
MTGRPIDPHDLPFLPPPDWEPPLPKEPPMAFNPVLLSPLFNIIERVLAKDDVPLQNKDAPHTATKVVNAIEASPNVAVVPVKSGWASKINWVQAGGMFASVMAFFGLDVPPDTLAAIIAGIQAAAALVTVVMRTWFTRSVTTKSVGSP